MFDFIQNIDISVIEKIYSFQHNLNSELFNKVMIFFTILGDNGMIWIAVALILFLNRKYRKIGVFSIVSLIICALAVNVILKPLIHRPRPFSELTDIILLIKAPKDYSFPSGHTAAAFMGAEFLWQEYKDVSPWYGIGGYVIAAGTGALRAWNDKYWVWDVVFGAGLGMLCTKLAYRLYPSVQRKLSKKKEKVSGISFYPYYNGQQGGLSVKYDF